MVTKEQARWTARRKSIQSRGQQQTQVKGVAWHVQGARQFESNERKKYMEEMEMDKVVGARSDEP